MLTVELILLAALLVHFIMAWKTQIIINKTTYLTPFQKRFNTFFLWAIPFVWGYVVRYMIGPREMEIITKPDRKRTSSSNEPMDITGLSE